MTDNSRTIIRTPTIPPGRYWQDLIGRQRELWPVWIKGLNFGKERVHVETTENFPGDSKNPARTFVIYTIKQEVIWDHLNNGSPTVADDTIHTSSDTAQLPKPTSAGETLNEALSKALTIGGIVAGSVATVAVVYVITTMFRARRGR
jgi:hypothetical protein